MDGVVDNVVAVDDVAVDAIIDDGAFSIVLREK